MPRDLFQYALYFVLVIGGIYLIMDYFADAERDSNVDSLTAEYTIFLTEMRKAHRGQIGRYGTGVKSDAMLIETGIAPESLQLSDTELKNTWNGDITVTGSTNSFFVDFGSIPKEVCAHFLNRFKADGNVAGFRVAATLGSVASASLTPLPINIDDANTLCAADHNAIRMQAG